MGVRPEDGGTPDRLPEMFSLPEVVLTESKRGPLIGPGKPVMNLSAADGTRFATLHDTTPKRGKPTYTLTDRAGRTVMTVAVGPGKPHRMPFVFTDGRGRPAGGVRLRNSLFSTLGLRVSADESADVLCLDRTALAGSAWLVKDDSDAELVRVTVSSAAGVTLRQRYEIRFDPRLTAPQRRALVGAVITLQALRRWLAGD
ncbi:hypothetical protein [Streptomyces sp. NPDC026673]|uniref:hypothetical protein n=1 Tax=Streptomyces sp. NPDC026673 TaxID=3155724 RepID=UPI0033C0484A